MSECVFCKIVEREIQSPLVFENEVVVAFDDIAPQAPVHVVVVPRTHYAHLGDGVRQDVLGALLAAAPQVAEIKGVASTGYRVIINAGADAAQSVQHLHMHVLGGARMAHGMVNLA